MTTEQRLRYIESVGEEIVTKEELKSLLEQKKHPIAYDGFEPSGEAHIAFGVFRPLLLEDMHKAGVRFKLFIADWHAWVNNKMGGDLEKIQTVGKYFIEVWKAAGVKNAEYVWASDIASRTEYWKKVILIAKHTTVQRATRALTIMGRKEGEMKEVAQYFYPMMQTADIFELEADICQLGLDQRRANMLAREVGPKLGWWSPVIVSHHMLMGLEGIKQPEGFEDDKKKDAEISSKMSKSKPSTAVFVHDSADEIKKKLNNAFCPAKEIHNNPVLEYCKYLVFRKFDKMKIERPAKFGGDAVFSSYNELEQAFAKGDLHPADLKNAAAVYIDKMIKPIRIHFEKGKAKELYDFVRKQEVTR
ncbi:MAG: tyrosine--tRNA ligase [Candidatus Aenigmarchaeota archaeon]|nr:tyrosine--tRNA ligase [Candidatus Aenigmarchaeota archaeon]